MTFAAAAKSLQSCLTQCDPIDGSPPGSPVPGILLARTLEWVAISFSNAWKWKAKVKSLSHVRLLSTPRTAAHQAPPSMGFSRQEYWSRGAIAFSVDNPRAGDISFLHINLSCNKVQFSHSVVSNSLWPHGLQHARLLCPSPTPRACSNSCPLSRWCHPTTSSSVIPFSYLQSFPESRSFQMSQFFTWGGQTIGVSASASVLPMNIQDGFALEWTGWISLQSKGLSRFFSNTTVQKHQFFDAQLSL